MLTWCHSGKERLAEKTAQSLRVERIQRVEGRYLAFPGCRPGITSYSFASNSALKAISKASLGDLPVLRHDLGLDDSWYESWYWEPLMEVLLNTNRDYYAAVLGIPHLLAFNVLLRLLFRGTWLNSDQSHLLLKVFWPILPNSKGSLTNPTCSQRNFDRCLPHPKEFSRILPIPKSILTNPAWPQRKSDQSCQLP